MLYTLRATPSLMRIAAADHIAYRAEMTIWILTAILPLFMLALWNAVVQDGSIAGFGQPELARYFAATLICRQLTGAWVMWELSFQIRSGRLSTFLLRPFHPLAVHAIWMLAALPFRIVILSPILGLLALWRPDLMAWPGLAASLLFLVSISLAWTMSYLVQCLFGCLSFWVDQSDGLFGMWFAVWMIASGYIAPIGLFPEAAQQVLRWLPFRGMIAVPVELLGGFLKPADALPDLAAQLAWTVTFGLLLQLTWTRGLRRYGAFGA